MAAASNSARVLVVAASRANPAPDKFARHEQIVEPARIVLADARSDELGLPGACRRFEALELSNNLPSPALPGHFVTGFDVLMTKQESHKVDGLDGLAAGPTVVTTAVYLVFSYLAGHVVLADYVQLPYVAGSGELSIFCGTIFGACLGFLWFNAYPAQMFMGDVGSLALGGAIGSIAIIIKQEFLLAIVGGVFVMEALSVIMQVGYFKMTNGKRIFLMAPFHHHFEKKGWHEPKVVVRFWIVSIILCLFAIATLKLR